jgi:hypothetical protein
MNEELVEKDVEGSGCDPIYGTIRHLGGGTEENNEKSLNYRSLNVNQSAMSFGMTDLYRIFGQRRFGRLLLAVCAPETMSCAEKYESGVRG